MKISRPDSPLVETFSWNETAALLQRVAGERRIVLGPKRRSFVEQDAEGNVVYEFVPPLVQPISASCVEEYLATLRGPGPEFALLIRAGAAAMGIWKDGELRAHKVITKYMVRKKQGKAQLTYLKQKGKSRAGSRLRLRESKEFFEEINGKLREWREDVSACDLLFYSCPVRLWSEFFAAKTESPFLRDDRRLVKIPIHVNTPNFKELRHILFLLSHGSQKFSPHLPALV